MESRNSELAQGRDSAVIYPRHFILLAAVAALGVADPWRPALGPVTMVGLFGAVNSTLLVAALRETQPLLSKLLFIAVAAALAMLSVQVGLASYRLLGTALGVGAPAALLTLSSGLGAATYALLIRHFWSRHLPLSALIGITLCCVAATLVALPVGRYLHRASSWWFAMIWWWSLSLALWYHDGRTEP